MGSQNATLYNWGVMTAVLVRHDEWQVALSQNVQVCSNWHHHSCSSTSTSCLSHQAQQLGAASTSPSLSLPASPSTAPGGCVRLSITVAACLTKHSKWGLRLPLHHCHHFLHCLHLTLSDKMWSSVVMVAEPRLVSSARTKSENLSAEF